MRRMLVAGNWKMHGLGANLPEIAALRVALPDPRPEVIVCPPATLLHRVAGALAGSPIRAGGQDCHWNEGGAHTGDISAAMLADAGAAAVILGHSERRADHGERSETVARKVAAAWSAGLLAIVCVGETAVERDAGAALAVVGAQLAASLPDGATAANCVIAYEPVWAIGTGRTPTPAEIVGVHGAIRAALASRFGAGMARGTRILYGGSVKPGNAAEILGLADVDGTLVGGASLRAADFAAIVAAAG
jgi:triosephosphate isomerase